MYGAGGFGREVACILDGNSKPPYVTELVCFIDDEPRCRTVAGKSVLTPREAIASHVRWVVFGAGNPTTRFSMSDRIQGFDYAVAVHSSVIMGPRIEVGKGSVICAGCILTCDISIGEHAHLNLDCTVGHDAVIGDFVTVSPGVHISGWVQIDRGAFIGTGANIINGREGNPLVIGEGAVVGAGACVTKSVDPGSTVVGVPAKPR